MKEKKSKHLECTVTEEGVMKFILIFDGNDDIMPSYDDEDDKYYEVECSSKVGDDIEELIFYSIRDTIDFKNYALKILRASEYVVCDAQYIKGNEIILKIRNNFVVSKGRGYTVEIDHDLGEDSKEGKEIEDICMQHQLDVEWRPKDLTSEDYKAL